MKKLMVAGLLGVLSMPVMAESFDTYYQNLLNKIDQDVENNMELGRALSARQEENSRIAAARNEQDQREFIERLENVSRDSAERNYRNEQLRLQREQVQLERQLLNQRRYYR